MNFPRLFTEAHPFKFSWEEFIPESRKKVARTSRPLRILAGKLPEALDVCFLIL